MKLYFIKLNNKLISTFTVLVILITFLTTPILHQTIDNNTTHFSIITALRMDIAEKQIQTPYFIIHSIIN
jgi:hypothetical protein